MSTEQKVGKESTSMKTQDVRAITDFLITDFEREIQLTLSIMDSVPNSNLDYRPDPKSKTGLGLLRHLVLEDEWLLNCIADGEFLPPPDDSDICGIMSPSDAIDCYKRRIPAALDRVRSMTESQLANVIDMFGKFQAPGINFLAMAVKHSVHHRGQLSTYLRAMGGKVPGIYGPSADTKDETV